MRSKAGIEIEEVLPGSPAECAGLRSGDILLSMNGQPVEDVIDFMFHKDSEELVMEFLRDGARGTVSVEAENDLGLTIKPFKVKTCRNNCLFCFVKQLPKGLRRSLYVKDEDYRLSFLYGNYMTLSNMDARARKKIIDQRLSPLYISVHSTNRSIRNRLLGNPRAGDIMKELKFFSDHRIRMHTQIVLCPGYNDGEDLHNTIRDLYKFHPYVASIAVVPVGLTMHRRQVIEPVTREHAEAAIQIVEAFQKRFKKKHGDPIVYCSDEMYIRAEKAFPPLKDYGAFPQIENGVGMVPLFVGRSRRTRVPASANRQLRYAAVTGTSFFPFLKKYADRLRDKGSISIDVIPVENRFFGTSVTVTGLLTGRDVIKTLHDNADAYEVLLVPDTALKEDEDIFLDDVSLEDVSEATGLRVLRTEASPQGLIDALTAG